MAARLHPSRRRARATGFSLIELSVVLVIIGLLVGGALAALESAGQQSQRAAQQRQLEVVRDGLYGFAMSRGRLPCPDADDPPDGFEDSAGASADCAEAEGALPWATLGLGRADPWGQPLRYRVEADFADQGGPAWPEASFTLADDATLTVTDGDGGNIVTNAPAVVVSFGPQGAQLWGGSGFPCTAPAGFSGDERENCDGNDDFVMAGFRGPDASDGRFDDGVIWLPLPVLKARMIDAGRLP